jgi:hypothetical protein
MLKWIRFYKERNVQSDHAQNDHDYDGQNGHAQAIVHALFNRQAVWAAINGCKNG